MRGTEPRRLNAALLTMHVTAHSGTVNQEAFDSSQGPAKPLTLARALQTSLESWNGWGWDTIHMATPENKQDTSTILRHVATLKKKRGNQEEVVFLWGWSFITKEHNRRFLSWNHLEKTNHTSNSYFTNPQKSICEESFPAIPTFSR